MARRPIARSSSIGSRIIYREENKTAEAVAAYKQLMSLGGDYVKIGYSGQIDAYRDAHQWKEATAVAAEAAKALPDDHSIQLMYAGQLADTGQVEKGLALAKAQLQPRRARRMSATRTLLWLPCTPVSSVGRRHLRNWTRPARWQTSRTKSSMCISCAAHSTIVKNFTTKPKLQFRKALAIDPQNPTILNYLGYMLADRGVGFPKLLTLIRKAVELDPQNYAFLDSLGWVYFKSGQYALAEENLRKANERSNSDPTVHDHLGEVYEKTGQPQNGRRPVGAIDDGVCQFVASRRRTG